MVLFSMSEERREAAREERKEEVEEKKDKKKDDKKKDDKKKDDKAPVGALESRAFLVEPASLRLEIDEVDRAFFFSVCCVTVP